MVALIKNFVDQQPRLQPPPALQRIIPINRKGRDGLAQHANQIGNPQLRAFAKSAVGARLNEHAQHLGVGQIQLEQRRDPGRDNLMPVIIAHPDSQKPWLCLLCGATEQFGSEIAFAAEMPIQSHPAKARCGCNIVHRDSQIATITKQLHGGCQQVFAVVEFTLAVVDRQRLSARLRTGGRNRSGHSAAWANASDCTGPMNSPG